MQIPTVNVHDKASTEAMIAKFADLMDLSASKKHIDRYFKSPPPHQHSSTAPTPLLDVHLNEQCTAAPTTAHTLLDNPGTFVNGVSQEDAGAVVSTRRLSSKDEGQCVARLEGADCNSEHSWSMSATPSREGSEAGIDYRSSEELQDAAHDCQPAAKRCCVAAVDPRSTHGTHAHCDHGSEPLQGSEGAAKACASHQALDTCHQVCEACGQPVSVACSCCGGELDVCSVYDVEHALQAELFSAR
jgi:hypothetical protein